MLYESYKRKIKELRQLNPNMKVVDVTPTSNSPLSPSPELMSDFRNSKITWEEFSTKFKDEMNNSVIEAMLLDIAKQAVNEDVYLICYEANSSKCHRSILLNLIKDIAAKNNVNVKVKNSRKVKTEKTTEAIG